MGHIYEKNGKLYPSVTTILSLFQENDSLIKWANIMGFKKQNTEEIRNKAAEFGTMIHSQLQHMVDNSCDTNIIHPKDPFEELKLRKILKHFKETFSELNYRTIYTEKELYHDKLFYAGTLDWLTEINNKVVLVDFKTSKHPYYKYRLQLGGYAELLHYNEGAFPDIGIIAMVNEDSCKLYPLLQESLKKYANEFKMLSQFFWSKFEDKENWQESAIDFIKNAPDNH